MSKPQIHWSHMAMLARCGAQYEFRYIQNKTRPPGVALIVGSSAHESVEKNLTSKIQNKRLLPVEEVQEIARDSVNRRWEAEGVLLDSDEKAQGEANVRGEAVDMAVKLSALHGKVVAPTIKVISVEDPWVLELDGFPRDLAGRFDIVEEKHGLRDTKTRKASPPKTEADDDDQLTVYSLAYKTIRKKTPRLSKDYLVKTKEAKHVHLETKRNAEDWKVFLKRIEAHNAALDAGVFIPTNQSNWWCSERFCGFTDICPYFRGRKVI